MHTAFFSPFLYLYVYLLIDPICAYLISPSIFLSPAISPSLCVRLPLSGQTQGRNGQGPPQ